MARRHASRCAWGMSCVLREHWHWLRSMRGPVIQSGPATSRPMASMTCGGRPSMIISCPRQAVVMGKRRKAAKAA
eukprot:11198078-Lingulodinium_polyedra.AAC.1